VISRVSARLTTPMGAAVARMEAQPETHPASLNFVPRRRTATNAAGRQSTARSRNVRPNTFALSMVNSVDCLSPSPVSRRLYAISNGRASEGKRVRARGGGVPPTVFAPSGRRGKPGKPHARRMHRSRNWRRGGGSSTDGARIKPPPLPHPAFPFPRPTAHGGWLLVGALLSRWKGVH